jgi:hypothetical protein
MKNKLILRTMGLLILIASLFMFSSCSKKTADGNLTKEQKNLQDTSLTITTIDQKDFTESDEDLTTVDYKEFYDQLAPHGEWVQVRPEEIGLKPKVASSKSSINDNHLLSNLLGIKDANASSNMDFGMIFVWSPSQDLSVTGTVGENHQYRPYRHGQWVYTDEGWYFRASTRWEETVHHHGRWVYSPTAGWLWVPGRVWAPAWVNWRQNNDYVSWAPLPPSDYLYDGYMNDPQIDDDYYVIVERRHFIDPDIYRYDNPYYSNGDRIYASQMTGTVGIVVVNNIIINRGPDVNIIQNIYGTNIDVVNIQHVTNFSNVSYSDRQYNVYTPDFKRYTSTENTNFTVNEPKSFKNYADVNKENTSNNNVNNPSVNNNVNTKVTNPNVDTKVTNPNINTKVTNPNVKGNNGTNPDVKGKVTNPNVKGNNGTNPDVKGKVTNPDVKGNNGTNPDVKGKVTNPDVKGNNGTNPDVKGKVINPEVKGNNGTNPDVKGKVTNPDVKGNNGTNPDVKGKVTNPDVKGNNGTNPDVKGKVINPDVKGNNGTNPDVQGKVTNPDVKGNPDVQGKVTNPDVKGNNGNNPDVQGKVTNPDVKGNNGTNPDVKGKVTNPDVKGNNETNPDVKGNGNSPDVKGNGNSPDVKGNGNSPDVKGNGNNPDVKDKANNPDVNGNVDKPDANDNGKK